MDECEKQMHALLIDGRTGSTNNFMEIELGHVTWARN